MIEIVFVLDRSYSMMGNQNDLLEGVNTVLEDQKSAGVEATVSMFAFDHHYEEICRHIPLAEASLELADIQPRGNTRLYDALGVTIRDMGKDYAKWDRKPNGIMFIVFTDGQENDSREYTSNQVKNMIRHQENNYNWEFIYLGAHKNAYLDSRDLGFKVGNTRQFAKSHRGFKSNYDNLSGITVAYAAATHSVDENMLGTAAFNTVLNKTNTVLEDTDTLPEN